MHIILLHEDFEPVLLGLLSNVFGTCVFTFVRSQQTFSNSYSDCVTFWTVVHPYIKKTENNLISLWTIVID